MCLAVPGRIIEIDNACASVSILGIVSTVNIQLIDGPQIGDYVLIHAGCAIQRINDEHFLYLQTVLTELLGKDKDNDNGSC